MVVLLLEFFSNPFMLAAAAVCQLLNALGHDAVAGDVGRRADAFPVITK